MATDIKTWRKNAIISLKEAYESLKDARTCVDSIYQKEGDVHYNDVLELMQKIDRMISRLGKSQSPEA